MPVHTRLDVYLRVLKISLIQERYRVQVLGIYLQLIGGMLLRL